MMFTKPQTLKYTIATKVVDGDMKLEIRDITASSPDLLKRDVMIRNLMRAAAATIRNGEDDGFSEADLIQIAKDCFDESCTMRFDRQYRIPAFSKGGAARINEPQNPHST